MKDVMSKTGWVCALLLTLLFQLVRNELETSGVIIGSVLMVPVALIAYVAYSSTKEEGIEWVKIYGVLMGSGITAAVFLLSYWFGCLNTPAA